MTQNVIFHVKSHVTKHEFWGLLILKSQHLMIPNLTWNETWNDKSLKKSGVAGFFILSQRGNRIMYHGAHVRWAPKTLKNITDLFFDDFLLTLKIFCSKYFFCQKITSQVPILVLHRCEIKEPLKIKTNLIKSLAPFCWILSFSLSFIYATFVQVHLTDGCTMG